MWRLPALSLPTQSCQEPFMRAGLYGGVEVQAFVNLWPQKAGFPPAA